MIKQYDTVVIGISLKLKCTIQNATFENQPRHSLHDENHLYWIIYMYKYNKKF